jgi:hypothetical protein
MSRYAPSYSYHETFRMFRHDTGYGVCTDQIPCLGVGPTPEHAIADLLQRVHRTRLASLLAFATVPDDAPLPPALDYCDGRLRVLVSGPHETCRYQVHLLGQVATAEGTPGSPLLPSTLTHTLFPSGLDHALQGLQDTSRQAGGH